MSLALWGQDVASQSHVASSGGGWPAGQQPCFAYRGAPGTVVVSAYAQRAATDAGGEHPALLPAPRVFTLPVRHTVSCLTMHPSKPLLAIGTNDHGAFVVPLFNTVKGVALGDTTPPATTSSATTGSSEGQPQQCDASSMALFSLDAKFINATSGNMVLAMTFLAGPSSSVPLLALCTSKRHPPAQPASGNAVHPQQPSGPAAASVFISLWGIEGSVARTLLWCSPPLADQSANTILALRASPERSTMVLCTRKELSLWRVAVGAGATSNQSRPTSGQSSAAASSQPVVLDVKHRPCSTIPELRGAEFVGIATPPLASHDSDDATTGSPTSGTVAASSAAASEHVFGLTTAGFLVCYDRNDGSIVKWMDCKVCPASSLACTSTHVVVCGATVRFFSLHSWDFCGKVAVDGGGPTASMDTSSAASGYLASLLRGLSVAVAATRHAACVFFGNGNTTHFRLTQGAEGKKKLTIAKCLTVPAFDAASLLNNDVRFLPSAHHTGGPPVVAWSSIQIRSMQPTTLMPLSLKELETTCAVVVALPISRRSSHAVTGEIAVTTVASKGTTPPTSATTTAHVLVAFDTTFHGIVVVSLVDGLRVLGQLPVDHTVNAFVALPVTAADGQDGIEGGDGSALEAVVLAVHNTVPSQVARFTLRGVCDAFGGLERVEIVLQHCRPLRRPVALQSAPLAAQSSSSSASAAVDESLSLVCTASGILCAVMGHAMWNVRTGAVLQLPFRSTAQHTSFAVCNERILIATDTESTLCIVDPTVPNEFRMFVFPTPFPCAPSGLVVDGGTHQVACLRAGTQSEIAVLNMRQKCCEVDRIVPLDTLPGHASNVPQPQAAESEVVGRRCAGQAYFHSLTFYSGGSALVLLEGTHGGVARLKVVPLSTTTTASPQGTSAPLVSPAPTPGPAVKKDRVPSTSPKNPTSRVGRVRVVEAIPAKEQHHVDPGDMPRNAPKYTATHRRRTMSCGATPEVAELEERYAELRQIADGMPSGTTSKSSRSTTNRRVPTTTAAPDLQSQGPSLARAGALGEQLQQQDDPSHALCCVGTRRNDPFRQSGLLLTKQVHESKGGDVVLRLGLRWGDMSHDLGSGGATPTKSTAGPGAPRSKRVLNLPVVRSHNSSITSAVDQSDDHDDLAPPSGPSQQRPFADPSYATELLLRRMKQRDAAACGGATTQGGEHPAPLGGKHKYEVAHQGNGDIVAVAVGTIEDAVRGSNVDVTDSLAQQLLANERSKIALPSLDAATAVAAAGCKESKAAQLPALQQPVGATVEDGEGHHHGPHRCNASPLKGKNEVVVFHRTAGDDEDFVVCGSVADVPAAVVAANRHQDPFAANAHRHDSFAGVGDDDEDASDVAYVQARTMTAGGPHPARAAFAATFHASSSSSMADGINNARPPPSRGPTMRGTLQQQGGGAGSRASDIKRAAERVRESLASLREILLTDDGGDTAGGTEPQDETEEDNEVSMQELNAVLADVVSTMLATSQRSRPSSAASNVPRSLSSRGVAGPSRRLTDDTPDVAASVAASTMTATSATTSAAASAVQFHLLWSEMQRLQAQNASILAAVQVASPKAKQTEGGAGSQK